MGAVLEALEGKCAVVFDSDGTLAGSFVVNGTSKVCFHAFETFVVGIVANIDPVCARRKLIASIQIQFRWP